MATVTEAVLPEGAEVPAPPTDPCFINISTIDRELYFEAARGRADGRRTRLFCTVSAIVMVVGLMMAKYIVVLLGLFTALLAIFSPILISKRDFSRLMLLHPEGSWQKTITFYEDRIEIDSGTGGQSTRSYDDIRKEIETPHMYILDFGKDYTATMLCKDGFTLGTMDELKTFLVERQRASYAPDSSGK